MQDVRYQNEKLHPYCRLGYKFVKWGLGIVILSFIFGFGVLIHYIVGSRWNTTNDFLSNVTLWFGSPLSYSIHYLLFGGLAMAAVGCAHCMLAKHASDVEKSTPTYSEFERHTHGSLPVCVTGLILLFLTGYIGYFVINAIWPGFYYIPFHFAKNLWLILQGISLLIFVIGLIIAFCCICHACKRCCRQTPTTKV